MRGSVIQIGTIQCPADRIAEGACALGRDDVNGHMLGLRHLHHRPRWRGMTSNEVVILELVRPVASAMMTTPEEHSASIPNAM